MTSHLLTLRRLFLTTALLLTATLCTKAAGEMPIIAYMGVPYDKTSDEHFKTFSECGFNVSLYIYPNLEQMIRACHIAEKYGVRILGHCTETHEQPEQAAARMKNVAGFFGYVLQDEPTSEQIAPLRREMERLETVDDSHCFYMNLLPYYDEGALRHLGVRTYEEYLDIAAATPCRQLSFDYYPVTRDGLREGWYENLETVRRQSLKAGKPFWGFVLSVPHYLYPQPTMGALRLQVFANLAYGAQAIQYFTYWTPRPDGIYDYHDGPVDAEGNKTRTYALVQQMNRELRAVAPLFYGARVTSVAHLGKVSKGAHRQNTVPENLSKLKVTGRRGAVITTFEQQGHRYVGIVNKDYRQSMKLQVSAKNATPRRLTKDLQEEALGTSYTIDAGDILIIRLT